MADQTDKAARKARRRRITRRVFLISGATVVGGLAVGVGWLSRAGTGIPERFARGGADGAVALNAWVRIEPDGTVALATPRDEMGQGIHTALAMLVAEELEVELDQVRVEHPGLHGVYTNYALILEGAGLFDKEGHPMRWVLSKVAATLPYVGTGGSTSVMDAWKPMRQAGAAARHMLVAAAAERWRVPAGQCRAATGHVIHPDGTQKLAYAELAAAAAEQAPPSEPPLKPAGRFRLIGKSQPRLDIPAKVVGAATFGIDVRQDGMLYAAVRHCPVKGGRITAYDAAAVTGMRGVKGVVEVPGGVAVVADNTWRAFKAAEALPIEVDTAGNGRVSSADLARNLEAGLADEATHVFEEMGEPAVGLAAAAKTIEADYAVPYLAHACMEPMNATVRVNGDGTAEVWSPNQSPTVAVWAVAEATGVAKDDVTSYTTYLGGGFGRRAEKDFFVQAAAVAKAFPGRAVKLTWTREQDMQNDYYRPMARGRFRAGLSGSGELVACQSRLASQSVEYEFGERVLPWGGGDGAGTHMNAAGAIKLPYDLQACRVEHRLVHAPVPVGFWRSVGHSQNAFFVEGFMDEVAHGAGQDPYAFRMKLLHRSPRHATVLEAAAKAAGWGRDPGPGRGLGIALHESFGSIVAEVAEVEVRDGEVRVHDVWCAVDCGTVVNPDTIDAQLQSAVIFGLTAALHGEITLAEGRIEQENFPDYEMVRMHSAPRIHAVLVPDGSHPRGIGEVGTPPIAPAVANAVFAATGQRIRSLPIRLEA